MSDENREDTRLRLASAEIYALLEEASSIAHEAFKEEMSKMMTECANEIFIDIGSDESLEEIFGSEMVKFSQLSKSIFDLMIEFDKIDR